MNDRIMISYKRERKDKAMDFRDLMEAHGLSPWFDKLDIVPGKPWPEQLRRQAMECDAMVALIDRAYLMSAYCRMEIFIVRSRNKPVLPVLLEDCVSEFDSYEETKGLGDLFFARLYQPSIVGLPVTEEELKTRVVRAAATLGRTLHSDLYVYISYGGERAQEANELANRLDVAGIQSWVATRDCRIGENWRQAQARGLMEASAQLLILDEHMGNAEVLRTELMLGEALGLPLFPIVPKEFRHADESRLAAFFEDLGKVHHTYNRVASSQVYRLSDSNFGLLARELRKHVNRDVGV